MNYKEMSNEELYQALREKFPGVHFKEVTEDNRHTVIAILGAFRTLPGPVPKMIEKIINSTL